MTSTDPSSVNTLAVSEEPVFQDDSLANTASVGDPVEPVSNQPAASEPVASEPGGDETIANEPYDNKPVVNEPAGSDPSPSMATTSSEVYSDTSMFEHQAAKQRKLNEATEELPALKSAPEMPTLADGVNLKCLLLEDTDLDCCPVHLRQLLSHFDLEHVCQNELLALLVYAVSLEVGFVSQQECGDYLDPVGPTSFFNAKNLLAITKLAPTYLCDAYKSHFTMQLCIVAGQFDDFMRVLLNCVVSGDFMIASLVPSDIDVVGGSSCLSVGRYVLSRQPRGEPMHGRLRKLDELSLKLRDELFIPMRNRLFQPLSPPVYPSLSGLPTDLYDKIFQNLSKNQMKIMANVSRDFYYCSRRSKHFGSSAASSKTWSFQLNLF